MAKEIRHSAVSKENFLAPRVPEAYKEAVSCKAPEGNG